METMNNKRRKYTRPYVGVKHDGTREVFRLAFRPTEDLWAGTYRLVIGPFKTTRGAQFMAKHGDDHTHSIREAERIATAHALIQAGRIQGRGRHE